MNLFEVSDPSEARGNTITAREVLDKGVGKIQEGLKDQPEIQAALMNTMGNVYGIWGSISSPRRCLEKTIELREKLFGGSHPAVAASLYNLSLLRTEEAEYERGAPLGRRAWRSVRRPMGPNIP